MASKKNQDRLKDDVMEGARAAGTDLLTGVNMDPRVAYQPGFYKKFMENQGFYHGDHYRGNQHKPMGTWGALSSIFGDPQQLIDNKVDTKIQEMLQQGLGKSGGMKKEAMGKALWTGAKAAFPWVFPAAGVGLAGHAMLKDKPYNADSAQTRGYAGAQAAIEQKMQNLSGIERMALRLDPSLMASKLEEFAPGTINHWENTTGNKFRPGWISGTMDAWKKGGTPKYYTYDAAGKRHYVG